MRHKNEIDERYWALVGVAIALALVILCALFGREPTLPGDPFWVP